MNHNHYDVIVAGAGSMGMAAGYFLAKNGARTLLIDAFDPPHAQGSHHGETRIIRHAYGEGRQYVTMALRAQELWEELQKETGSRIFERTGVLGAGDPSSPFIAETFASAAQYGLPVERLSADDIKKRWPGITVPDHFVGCFEPNSGVLFSEACIKGYRELALKHGAELKINSPVEAITYDEHGVIVQSRTGTYHANKLIVAAGAWTQKLLSSLNLPLKPTRKVFAWFETKTKEYSHPNFPAFSFVLEDRTYYGFPSFDDGGLKIGRHDGGEPIQPGTDKPEFGTYDSDEGDLRFFLDRYMPHASGQLKQGKVCMYTLTPDEHFIIDHHPESKNIVIAAGFSGHGFKFSSVIGEILSQLVTGTPVSHDLSLFSLKRFN
ncbi:MAG: N-methyl-L-tryptophan oxidase [Tuberibacillus sp.]